MNFYFKSPLVTLCSDKVLAVIVSFNGGSEIVRVIQSLTNQVDYIYVVDNNSTDSSIDMLRSLCTEGLIDLFEMDQNMGIGFALNRGVERAISLGCSWLLTMDQDSIPNENMVKAMLEYHYLNNQVKCLSPNLISINSKNYILKSGSVPYVITSGNLLHLSVFDITGSYDESYFIDYVDFEFSLRIRKFNMEIHKVSTALMYHSVGEEYPISKYFKGFYNQHSPLRRYYFFRNIFFLTRSYFFFDLKIFIKLFLGHFVFFILMLFYEKNLSKNFLFIFRGVIDGATNKRGNYFLVKKHK
jgi:rhamnosyltransferase